MEKALRYNESKPKWSHVDFDSLEPMVRILEYGAKKYAPNNYKKGRNLTEQIESLLRHCFELLEGKDIDAESKLPTIGHIQANAMMIAHTLKHHPEFDDRYKPEPKKCYISGAISSLHEDINQAATLAIPIFLQAELEVKELGYTPVNLLTSDNLADGDKWIDYMEKDIPILAECQAIYMLKNYAVSNGARLEKSIVESYAKKLNLEVIYQK